MKASQAKGQDVDLLRALRACYSLIGFILASNFLTVKRGKPCFLPRSIL